MRYLEAWSQPLKSHRVTLKTEDIKVKGNRATVTVSQTESWRDDSGTVTVKRKLTDEWAMDDSGWKLQSSKITEESRIP